jgi:hypothetical protein
MGIALRIAALACVVVLAVALGPDHPAVAADWTIYVANDNCPDYTWGLTEEQTRQAFADIIKGHLDEMKRTDAEPWYNQDRYNAAVTQEVLCFLEKYPDRKDELVRRIKEGRLFVSPYLCNTLWGFQSVEGTIRAFYPARRLERELGIRFDYAHHIELPSLPWGTPTILAGCGIKALTVPYYAYDSTFGGLTVPPVFWHEGPDGSRILVCMDRFASGKSSYTQGAYLLRKPEAIEKEWLPHYAKLGKEYPLHSILASGTHGDISPTSGSQARGFAEALIKYNARPDAKARLVNATFPQFWQAVEKGQSQPGAPPLPVVRGDFGHSWELWPVSLAKYAAEMRTGEQKFLAAEALLAIAGYNRPDVWQNTWKERQRAEWCWAMLSDHAWNGTDARNKHHNADLRRTWAIELHGLADALAKQAWDAIGLHRDAASLVLFNCGSAPQSLLLPVPILSEAISIWDGDREIPRQIVRGDSKSATLLFIPPELSGFAFRQIQATGKTASDARAPKAAASQETLESPYFRASIDRTTGGLKSLIHKPTRRELLMAGSGRTLGETVYFDGEEHRLNAVTSRVVAPGPVAARVETRGRVADIEVATLFTVYAGLDEIDVLVSLQKPPSTKQERLCHVFPVLGKNASVRAATGGAVVRPKLQPEGDLLPGADTRRFAVQQFLDVSEDDFGVTIFPRHAFALRLDLDPITIEALGDDQNHREVSQDQDRQRVFKFSYTLRAHAGAYQGADAYASSSALGPLAQRAGRLDRTARTFPRIEIDPKRAIATCLKPADGPEPNGVILRLQETAGKNGPLAITVEGYSKAVQTDLLERDLKPLAITGAKVTLDLRPNGFAAVRLVR